MLIRLASALQPKAAQGDLFNVSWAASQLKALLTLCVIVVAIAMFRFVIKGRISALITVLACLILVGFVALGNPLQWGANVGGQLFNK